MFLIAQLKQSVTLCLATLPMLLLQYLADTWPATELSSHKLQDDGSGHRPHCSHCVAMSTAHNISTSSAQRKSHRLEQQDGSCTNIHTRMSTLKNFTNSNQIGLSCHDTNLGANTTTDTFIVTTFLQMRLTAGPWCLQIGKCVGVGGPLRKICIRVSSEQRYSKHTHTVSQIPILYKGSVEHKLTRKNVIVRDAKEGIM